MEKYFIDCHFDMVIPVEVIADNEAIALRMAYDQAADTDIMVAECVGHSECITDSETVTAEDLRRMEREAVTNFVHEYIDQTAARVKRSREHGIPKIGDIYLKELEKVASGYPFVFWGTPFCYIRKDDPMRGWLKELFNNMDFNKNRHLYERYLCMYAKKALKGLENDK